MKHFDSVRQQYHVFYLERSEFFGQVVPKRFYPRPEKKTCHLIIGSGEFLSVTRFER